MEIWEKIEGYPKHSVSNYGRVKSVYRELRPAINKGGYKVVNLSYKGKTKVHYVHKLVWDAFMGVSNDKKIDHINNNTSDARLDNLQLLTHRDNISKGFQIKRSLPTGVSRVGNKFISQIYGNGKRIWLGRFSNLTDAHRAYQTQKQLFQNF